MKEGTLRQMLDTIRQFSETTPLFFYHNIAFLPGNTCKRVQGIPAFVSATSFWVTWIANFGNWRSVIDTVPLPDECAPLLLTQVDWSFKIMSAFKNAQIYFGDYFQSVTPARKGGYNLFEVFVTNYLSIVRRYIRGGWVFQCEKYRLFRYFLLQWIDTLSSNNSQFTFEKDGIWKILRKEYRYCPYFYAGIFALRVKSLIKK